MKRTFLLLSFLVSFAAFAADAPKPELFIIHEEVVKPSAVAAYEAASKDFLGALWEKKVTSPAFNWMAAMTTDFHYIYIMRIENFAALDRNMAEWEKAKQTVGAERWASIERRGNEPLSSYSEVVSMYRPDLSYIPATPRLKPEENRYVRLQFFYLIPGKEKDAEAIAKDYISLFKQKNMGDGFRIYMSILGEDLPLLVASIHAKSAADYAAMDERTNTVLGADLRALQARAMSISRRFEQREAMIRPDLSYPGMPMAAEK
jgi:hypothetical protein